jgi:uncharacterized membrane protein YgcG
MRAFDFSTWQGVLTTLMGLAVITLMGVGIRLLVMQTLQRRRERENRQINERLRTLMAAYKTLGGSFTGDLSVDPTHLRELRERAHQQVSGEAVADATGAVVLSNAAEGSAGARARRIRDAVEAALSDVILLGTEEQVRLAARAANDMVERRPIHTAELVVSLRNFIRQALGLESVPRDVTVPHQGPTRPASGGGGRGGGRNEGGDRGDRGGRGGGGGGGGGGGVGMGMGLGVGASSATESTPPV